MDPKVYIQSAWSAPDVELLKAEFALFNHRAIARFACDCAERACQRSTADKRAYAAILAGRGWADGITSVDEARAAAFAAHEAARAAIIPTTQYACRSAGHAAATAHVITHAVYAANFAAKAAPDALGEREWQYNHLLSLLQNMPVGFAR
ncbi:MAG TPA: hypothetical protein VN417_01085 [Candidatus Cryosericum sp.]|nr:hypothetical protein [Candidatus Cryosericum sp.]